MPSSTPRVKDIFDHALEIESPIDRIAYLDDACRDAPEVRQQVEALLQAYAEAGSFLDKPHPDVTGELTPSPEVTGDFTPTEHGPGRDSGSDLGMVVAGRYRLVEVLGEGGMGTVYVAEQSEPVKRRVALKLIKSGMDSRTVLVRFEAERQALALMDHPNIARIYDGGVTPSGQPFFVMELVKGVPLTEYCDSKRLSVDARFQLFVQVCQAVQHAHQKGIIHRDLKPGNVLVTEVDGRPTPKVIDFGVAKATEQKLTDQSFADVGQIVGTPAYMSPEQADPSMDIDTRTDVYALGVILYEMLVGSPPIDSKQFKRGAILEMLRMVREVEPPRPSTKLSTADALPNIAASRSIEPAKLAKLLQGELDWVVMKALEKDRTRRYDTANGLARDIQRYLADEVVEARPPSRGYRLKKFVRRHKGQVIAASLVMVALVAGITGTTLGLLEAMKQTEIAENKAEGERQAKEREAERAAGEQQAKLTAQQRYKDVARANEILSSIFLALNPDEVQKEQQPLRALLMNNLERAADQMRTDGVNDPELTAQTQMTFGVTMLTLGSTKQAIALLESAQAAFAKLGGPDHPEALKCASNIAHAKVVDGRLKESVDDYEALMPRLRSVYGVNHGMTLVAMLNLGTAYKEMHRFEKGQPILEEVLRIRRKNDGTATDDLLACMDCLASCYQDAGDHNKAEPLFEEAYTLAKLHYGPKHLKSLVILNNISGIHHAKGRISKAIESSREALNGLRQILAPDHSIILVTINNLASYLKDAKRYEEALPLMEEIYRVQNAKAGANHPLTINFLMNLAGSHMQLGQHEKALPMMADAARRRLESLGPDNDLTEKQIVTFLKLCQRFQTTEGALPLLEETLRRCRESLGPNHARTMGYLTVYASFCSDMKRPEIGVPILEQISKIRQETLGQEDPLTLQAKGNLATAYWRLARYEKSIPLFEELVRIYESKSGRNKLETMMMVANLGVNYRDAGRYAEAIPLLREAKAASERHPALTMVVRDLMVAYQRAGMTAELKSLVEEALADISDASTAGSTRRAGGLAQLAVVLTQERSWVLAEPILRECLAIREQKEPDTWTTFNTQSMLGGALLGQKKYADAEPLLLKGYEGMKAREKTIPQSGGGELRIPEALDRLIELYTATKKPDEVKKYQELRAKYPTSKEVLPPPRPVK